MNVPEDVYLFHLEHTKELQATLTELKNKTGSPYLIVSLLKIIRFIDTIDFSNKDADYIKETQDYIEESLHSAFIEFSKTEDYYQKIARQLYQQ